jgi:hypothetical protein
MRITNIVNLALKLGSWTHVMNGTFTDRPGNSRTNLGRRLFRQTCINHQDVYLRYETYGEKGEGKGKEVKSGKTCRSAHLMIGRSAALGDTDFDHILGRNDPVDKVLGVSQHVDIALREVLAYQSQYGTIRGGFEANEQKIRF